MSWKVKKKKNKKREVTVEPVSKDEDGWMDENALRSKVNVEMTIEEERMGQVQVQVRVQFQGQGQGSPVLGRVRKREGENEREKSGLFLPVNLQNKQ